MGRPDTELKIISLVRYVDACDPARRHRDCPYAVERDGTRICREECREVLASTLRHGRVAAPAARTFDARELLLGETGPTPHMLWHTSSLLQVVLDVAQTHPLLDDGTLNLRRLVDATSALGALGCRGLDPDRIVRRGIAETMKLTLAGWLERLEFSDEPRGTGEHAARWRAFFRGDACDAISPGGYIEAIWLGKTARRLNAWLETAPLEDVLRWTPPEAWPEPGSAEPADEETKHWTWVVDRFTQTYLAEWSSESLKREYRYLAGAWSPGLPHALLAERELSREDVATALADRAVADDDAVDPATMTSLTGQAVALLEEGQRKAAAALLDGARRLRPSDLTLQQNHAFCILVDEPEKARAAFMNALARDTRRPEVALCNLALTEALLGNVQAAFDACELAYTTASYAGTVYLWVQGGDGWSVENTDVRRWAAHLGAELEQSRGVTGRWAQRKARVTQFAMPSASPSSAGTDGEGP
ncbi:hypothetical protein ABZ806_38490 [Spirillospora sp. NPDC047418]|jgi:hypothetical protein